MRPGMRRHVARGWLSVDGEGGNRTHDTTIFSRVLYQLSYLAWEARWAAQGGRLATGRERG